MTDEKIAVGIDIDGCLADYTKGLAKVVSREKGIPLDQLIEPSSFNFNETPWDLDTREKFLHYHNMGVEELMFYTLDVLPGAAEATRTLHEEGFINHIITSRFFTTGTLYEVNRQTISWLDKNNICCDEYSLTNTKEKVHVDIAIDDAPHNILAYQANNIPCIIFDHPYNRELNGLRFGSWDEIVDFLLRFKQVEHDNMFQEFAKI